MITIFDLRDLIQNVADRVVEALPADRVVVAVLDIQAKTVIHFVQGGEGYGPDDTLTYEQLDEGLTGWVLRELKPVLSPYDIIDPREGPEAYKRRGETGTGDVIVVPLMYLGEIFGTMTAINVIDGTRLGQEELELMEVMASQVSLAIRNANLYEEMVRQKSFSELLVKNSPVAIVTTDAKNQVTSWNPAAEKLFDVPVDSALGKDLVDLISMPCDPVLAQEADILANMQANGQNIHATTQRCLRDGSTVEVEIYGSPVEVNGNQQIYLTIYHNITELKSVQNQLIQANETIRNANRLLAETNRKMENELILAGDIQASFLPERIPMIDGWQFATFLKPSRETSGDFYDLQSLNDQNLGFMIADVVDKGVGAAIFMALSWTLIRAHAERYYKKPNLMFCKVNQHILAETHSHQFLTAFYGSIDTKSGELTYCNAGHNPPILYNREKNLFTRLASNGMALGISRDASWEQASVAIHPGEILILYTDGITDANNIHGEFFDEKRLLDVIEANHQRTAQQILEAIIKDLHQFTGSEVQDDDVTLMVISRE